ncbi:MAG: TolC family protein [Gammaproteobacteria bacterium]
MKALGKGIGHALTALPLLFSTPLSAQSLTDLYAAALDNNPAFRVFELRVEEAEAQYVQSRSQLLPQLSASADYNWNEFDNRREPVEGYAGTRGIVQASQALFDLVSYFRLKGTGATVREAEQRLEAARMNLAGDVIDRYLSVLEANDDLHYVRAEKRETAGQRERLEFMHERQLAKITDLRETEAYYQGLLTREIEATNARAIALEALRELTGVLADGRLALQRTAFDLPPDDADGWVDVAKQNNGMLIALGHAIEAARNLLRSNRAGRLPSVALTSSFIYSDQGFDNRAAPAYDVTSVGVQVTVPLFEGGRITGSVREAGARYAIAVQEYEQTRRQIESETRTAFLNALASHARMGSTDSEESAMARLLDAQEKSYDLGASTIVDVLRARRRLFKARSDQLRARYDYIRDMTALRIRAGALSDGDLAEIDSWLAQTSGGAPGAAPE